MDARQLLPTVALFVFSTSTFAQAQPDRVPPFAAGLVLHVGTTDGKVEAELASRPGQFVLGLAIDRDAGNKARLMLSDRKLLGRATVLDQLVAGSVPVASNTAVLVIADLDQLGKQAPTEKELLRVTRPLGTLRVKRNGKWSESVKPWPKEFDDWPMYFRDAAGTDVSQDTAVGPVRGLQWHTGDGSTNNRFGLRSRRGIIVSAEEPVDAVKKKSDRLVARDAFTGIKLWERNDLSLTNRYAMLLDDERIFLHADGDKHMTTLDLATGKTIRALDQGLDFTGINYRAVVGKASLWPQAVVHQGKLVQVGHNRIYVLDAATGKKLWMKDLQKDQAHLPTALGDVLAVVEGSQAVRSPAYLFGWNCCQLESVAFYELATGKELRRWAPGLKAPHYALHMCASDKTLAIMAGTTRSGNKEDDETRLFCVDFTEAKTRWSNTASDLGKGGFGGHGTNWRVFIQNDRVWATGLRTSVGYSLKDGTDPLKINYLVSQCQPIRATTNYHLAALCAVRLEDQKLMRSEASRPACDIGPFPSNGLIYTTATNCGCHPFLSGYNAFHSEAMPDSYRGDRLQTGDAKPAPSKDDRWPSNDAWPMYMRDAQRSNWTPDGLPADKLKQAWTMKFNDPAEGLPATWASDWRRTDLSHAPITAPTAAEGVVIFAVPDAHEVVALDPDTGKHRWRIHVDGRVDSPPTIYRGLVLFGTRNGWVYAVNRDNGALVWRHLAAPTQRQIVSCGQSESTWPVFGTVLIHDNLAWVLAGRGTQLDGGLFWHALDPMTGKSVKSGVLSSLEEWRDPAAKKKGGYPQATLDSPPDTASPWAVTADGKQLLMSRVGLEMKSGKMLKAGVDYWFPHDSLAAHFAGSPINFNFDPGLPSCVLPRRFGLLYNGVDRAALNSVSFYAGTLAKIFAYKDGDFVALLSNNPPQGRGGSADGLKRWHSDLIGKIPPAGKQSPAKLIWNADYPAGNKDAEPHQALVKAGDFVLVGYGKKLLVYRYADGKRAAEYALPALPVHNGVAVAAGRVIVCCHDGSVICFRP